MDTYTLRPGKSTLKRNVSHWAVVSGESAKLPVDTCSQLNVTLLNFTVFSSNFEGSFSLDIIHCVGPIGENDAVLSSCYESALDTLKVNNLRSIAFPAISTGQYGYSAEKAVPVVLKAIRRWLEKPVNLASVDRIIVVRYLDQDTALFKQHMPKYFSQ